MLETTDFAPAVTHHASAPRGIDPGGLLERGIEWVLILSLGICLFCALIQAAVRYLPWIPIAIAWPDELARGMMGWLTFMGAAILIREERHIRMEIPDRLIPGFFLRIRGVVMAVLMLVVLLVIVRGAFSLVVSDLSMTLASMPGSLAMFSGAILLGSLLQILYTVQLLISRLRTLRGQ